MDGRREHSDRSNDMVVVRGFLRRKQIVGAPMHDAFPLLGT